MHKQFFKPANKHTPAEPRPADIDRSVPYGLALGGGGTRGSYEIGVWAFLREYDIPIGAIAGTSIGSVNGAMMIQGDFKKAQEAWLSLDISMLTKANEPPSKQEREQTQTRFLSDFAQDVGTLARLFIENRGIDMAPLRTFLETLIDEPTIRTSTIDYHLVTVDISNFKPKYFALSDIPEGELIDYILASCSVPIFKLPEIDGNKFLDGGFHDNVPVAPLAKDGYHKIIAIDLSSFGFRRSLHTSDVDLIHIKNSEPLGATFQFDLEKTKRNLTLGYLDTKKAFGQLRGVNYFLSYAPPKDVLLRPLASEEVTLLNQMLSLPENPLIRKNLALDHLRKQLVSLYGEGAQPSDFISASLEVCAEQLGVKRIKVYTLDQLLSLVQKAYKALKDSHNPEQTNIDRLKEVLGKKDMAKLMANQYLPVILEDNTSEQNASLMPILALSLPRYSVTILFLLLLKIRQENIR